MDTNEDDKDKYEDDKDKYEDEYEIDNIDINKSVYGGADENESSSSDVFIGDLFSDDLKIDNVMSVRNGDIYGVAIESDNESIADDVIDSPYFTNNKIKNGEKKISDIFELINKALITISKEEKL